MSTILGWIVLGFIIMIALFFARLALSLIIIIISGIIQLIVWVGQKIFVRSE